MVEWLLVSGNKKATPLPGMASFYPLRSAYVSSFASPPPLLKSWFPYLRNHHCIRSEPLDGVITNHNFYNCRKVPIFPIGVVGLDHQCDIQGQPSLV